MRRSPVASHAHARACFRVHEYTYTRCSHLSLEAQSKAEVPTRSNDGTTAPVQADHTFALEGGLSGAMAAGYGGVLVIEGAVLHLWVVAHSEPWAWAITALNVVTVVWLWREYRAAAYSRLVVGERHVEIAIGNRLRCRFSRSVITSAAAASWRSVPEPPPPDYINTAKPLEPNVMLVLDEPVEAHLPLGMRRRYARIGIRVRDQVDVLAVLNSPIASPRTRS
jgi:hypothetical protein